jgi:hypothetical protein
LALRFGVGPFYSGAPHCPDGPGGGKRCAIVTAFAVAHSRFGRAVDEIEHIEHALAAFNVCHERCH